MKKIKLTMKDITDKKYDDFIGKLISKHFEKLIPSKEEKEEINKLMDDYLDGKMADLKKK